MQTLRRGAERRVLRNALQKALQKALRRMLQKELRNCDDEEEKQDIEDEMNDIKVMIGYLKEGLGIKTNN